MFDCRDSPGAVSLDFANAPTWAEQLGQWQGAGRISASLSLVQWSSTWHSHHEKNHSDLRIKICSVCLSMLVCLCVFANCRELRTVLLGHGSGTSLRPPVPWIGAENHHLDDELIEHIEHIEHIWIHLQQHCVVQILCCSDWLGLARKFHGGRYIRCIWCSTESAGCFKHWDGDGASVWRLSMFDHVPGVTSGTSRDCKITAGGQIVEEFIPKWKQQCVWKWGMGPNIFCILRGTMMIYQ